MQNNMATYLLTYLLKVGTYFLLKISIFGETNVINKLSKPTWTENARSNVLRRLPVVLFLASIFKQLMFYPFPRAGCIKISYLSEAKLITVK